MTVSRVFSGRGPVSDELRKKVILISREHEYTPNPLARGLAGQRTQNLGLIWWHMHDMLASELMIKIVNHLQGFGFVVNVADCSCWAEKARYTRILEDFDRRRFEGVVAQLDLENPGESSILDRLRRFPAAVIATAYGIDAPCDQVILERRTGFIEAAEYFVASGRKTPVVMGRHEINQPKFDAFCRTLQNHNVPVKDATIIELDYPPLYTDEELRTCVWRNLTRRFPQKIPFDALMCTSDQEAWCAIAWFHSRGLRVPQEVAVVGFGDYMYNSILTPPLASVDRRLEQTACAIDTLLMNRLKQPDLPPQKHVVNMKFIWRESAGS